MSITPEGDVFRTALTDAHTTARLRVAGVRACSCGRPDCPQPKAGVMLSIDSVSAMAMTPEALRAVVEALQTAASFVWPEGGGT